MLIRDRIVELRRVRASELIAHPKNWRRHPEPQRRALQEVLAQVGYADSLIARQTPEGLVLIDGHLRRDLDPEARVPVLVVDVDEQEAETLLASLDPLAAMAVADQQALEELLASAVVPDEALLEHLQTYLGHPDRAGRTDPEEIPARPRTSRVRPGELWALGVHRMLCGDATSEEDVRRVMAGTPADVVWTDPPYGVGYRGKTAEELTLRNDRAEGLEELLKQSFVAMDGVLRPGGRIYVAHPAGALSMLFAAQFVAAGWRLHQILVWVKDRMVLGHADYHFRHEPLLYGYKPGPGRWGRGHQGWYGANDQDSVFEVPRPAASRDHPTAKPVELIRRCLANSSARGQAVLDPFAGSGSTLIAAEELHRVGYAMELDPLYCEVILTRWEAFAGTRAERVDG